jgi:hypothetical protein
LLWDINSYFHEARRAQAGLTTELLAFVFNCRKTYRLPTKIAFFRGAGSSVSTLLGLQYERRKFSVRYSPLFQNSLNSVFRFFNKIGGRKAFK